MLEDTVRTAKDKAAEVDNRAPLQYLEPAANESIARALASGNQKYGIRNYLDLKKPVRLSVYLGAIQRHLDAIKDGEWMDKSGYSHVAHIGANVHILEAAQKRGNLWHDMHNVSLPEVSTDDVEWHDWDD